MRVLKLEADNPQHPIEPVERHSMEAGPDNYDNIKPTSEDELLDTLELVRQHLTDEYYQHAYDFPSRVGLSEYEVCIPMEIWAGIAQAIADASGYTVQLRAELLEPGKRTDEYVSVGQRVVFNASPTLFVVPGNKNGEEFL